MKVIYFPQYPVKMRYQEWWLGEFRNFFIRRFPHVVTLMGDMEKKECQNGTFSPRDEAIRWELQQIDNYLKLPVEDDDIVFIQDISFPGLVPQVLFHKRPRKIFGFCHATAKNRYDVFHSVRRQKWLVEKGISRLFTKVFVATEYHKKKLGWKNVIVTGVPVPPFTTYKSRKTIPIISVARPSIQKTTQKIEKVVEKLFNIQIYRAHFSSWSDYYQALSKSKILLVTCKEDTWGYAAQEAFLNRTVPLVPNAFAYQEWVPRQYRWDNVEELVEKIKYFLKYPYIKKIPKFQDFWGKIKKEIEEVL